MDDAERMPGDDEDLNPCQRDLLRMEEAAKDDTIVERRGEFERRLAFVVGYDHRSHPGACGHGGHGMAGMEMHWTLVGPAGAVTWVVFMTNWVPGNFDRIGAIQPLHSVSASVVPVMHRELGDGSPAVVTFHSPSPFPGVEGEHPCAYLPAGYCYSDSGGLISKPVLAALLAHGPRAVWATLESFYQERFATAQRPGPLGDESDGATNVGGGEG